MAVTFFDVLGIDADPIFHNRVVRASEIWPYRKLHFLLGDSDTDNPAAVERLMEYLQATLQFISISPGATPDTVGFYAEIAVKNVLPTLPLVIRTMPDLAFFLQDTRGDKPARCYVTKTDSGTEVVIEALPVEIQLPGGLLEPLTEADDSPPPLTNDFEAGTYDSYQVDLKMGHPSSIKVHIKVRATQELDFIVEPAVVLSVGPCLFSGLPCFGLHDISFIAAPTLTGDHHKVEQAIEWTRHTIEPSESLLPGDTNFRGVLAVRTVDLDTSKTPFTELNEWINAGQPQPGQIQFVLQDVVIPFFSVLLLPLPIHATFGIRRNIEFGDRVEEAYSFASVPVKIEIGGFLLLIEEFIIETVDPEVIEESQVARIKIIITRGQVPKVTSLTTAIDAATGTITVEDNSVFEKETLKDVLLIIDRTDPTKREIVKITSEKPVNPLQVVRGQADTLPVSHAAGAVIELDQFAQNAITLGFTEEWTAQAGWRRRDPLNLFTIGDNTVKLIGAKLGFSFKRLYEQNHSLAKYSLSDYGQILVDLSLDIKPSKNPTFRIEALSSSFRATTLSNEINATATTIAIDNPTAFDGVPLPATFIIDRIDPASQEIVQVNSRAGNQLDVVRGQADTVSVNHVAGATIEIDRLATDGALINVIWKDVGWNLGSLAFGGVQLPEGVQIVIANFLRVIIQEIAIPTDKNGGTYFSVTGGVAVAGEKYAATILINRFRWRIAGNENAPQWLLDGISFALKINSFELSGTGMVSEFTLNEHNYQEAQYELDLKFTAFSKRFELGLFLFKGEVSGPVDNFKYWLFGFKLGYLPLASLDCYDIRVLAAQNLAPNLPPPDASDQNLRLFKWYKNALNPLSVSSDRKMNAWKPQNDSIALGVGMGGAIGGTKALLLDLFMFAHEGADENGLMIALNLFLLKSKKPVGFGVLELDIRHNKWAFFVGVSLSFNNVLPEGTSVPGLDNVAALSGSLYIGNQPGTFALGQLSDQDTWLGFRMKSDRFFKMQLILALCIQYVDRPEGPVGFGALISAKGGASFGVGKAEFYLTLLLIAGMWKNESSASGLIILFEAGFRIKLFRVFHFGATIKIQLDFLGPNPEYKRLAFEIHIDTPWYLPDVTIRFEKIYSEPQPEQQPLISTPIISAESFAAGVKKAGPVLLTALQGATLDEKQLFDMNQLRSLQPQSSSQSTLTEMTAIGVDSTIVLNFKPPVDDKLTIGETTPAGAGTQAAVAPATSELSVTYELIALSIRRQPRYGTNANQWTTLLAPADTQLPSLEDWPSGTSLEALFSSDINVLWDRDVQSQGRLDPRRLLINAETPFTLITENAEADESIFIYQPGWPCCTVDRKPVWHQITFTLMPNGHRVPVSQKFSDSNSTLHWLYSPRPVVAPSQHISGQPLTARIRVQRAHDFRIAVINFDQPVYQFRLAGRGYDPIKQASIVIEGYNGLDLLSAKAFSLTDQPNGQLLMEEARGFTRMLLRFIPFISEPGSITGNRTQSTIELLRVEYRTVQEQLLTLTCQSGNGPAKINKGKLAWLPNHNYEITATTRAVLQHNQSGAQEATMVQRAYFRTKGMIGLNAVEHVGQEIDPYLEAVYPAPETAIVYREEPIALAFREQFNILLPVDRNTNSNSPDELNQVLEWDLTVDKQGDPFGRNRISKSNLDWIVANRGIGTTNPFDFTILIGEVFFTVERKAKTTSPMQQRLRRILASPHRCDASALLPPKSSQVLLHTPADPSKPADSPDGKLWEANTFFKANLKPKGGPCIHRNPFEADDLTALKFLTDQQGTDNAWAYVNGTIQLQPTANPGFRHYAVFGEADWNHVQVSVQLDPQGAIAGFALGVTASLFGISSALLALVDEADGVLKLIQWRDGHLTTLQQTAIPQNVRAPFQLELVAYDDQLELRLDEVRILTDRGDSRSGQLALVGQGGGAFTRLTVEALDGYRFYFQSSRFTSFTDHIQSANRQAVVIPAGTVGGDETLLIQDLNATTGMSISQLMQTGADPTLRQTLFMCWADILALPLVQQPQGLVISRLQKNMDTLLLLLESPEPLRFSGELTLQITKKITQGRRPRNPDISVLEPRLPSEFSVFERQILASIPDVKLIAISAGQVDATIVSNQIQFPHQAPRFALVALNHEGNVKYFLLELTISSFQLGVSRVRGRIRDERDFTSIFNRPIIPTLENHLGTIQPNQLFMLDARAERIKTVALPDLSIAFFAKQSFRLLSSGNENQALLIPISAENGTPIPWTSGMYIFHFILNRQRYPQELSDVNALYTREAKLDIAW